MLSWIVSQVVAISTIRYFLKIGQPRKPRTKFFRNIKFTKNDLQFVFWKILFKTTSSATKLTKPIEDTLLRDESSKGFEHGA